MPPVHLLVVINLVATAAMTGLIWFVQIVHYPLFGRVGGESFVAYENAHTVLTGYVVVPFMLAELATAGLLLAARPDWMPAWAAIVGAALVAVIWASTFLLQVPQHNALSQAYDARAHALLVGTNWVRTVCWSARTVLMGWVVLRGMNA